MHNDMRAIDQSDPAPILLSQRQQPSFPDAVATKALMPTKNLAQGAKLLGQVTPMPRTS
jgi:hypothetical protein